MNAKATKCIKCTRLPFWLCELWRPRKKGRWWDWVLIEIIYASVVHFLHQRWQFNEKPNALHSPLLYTKPHRPHRVRVHRQYIIWLCLLHDGAVGPTRTEVDEGRERWWRRRRRGHKYAEFHFSHSKGENIAIFYIFFFFGVFLSFKLVSTTMIINLIWVV